MIRTITKNGNVKYVTDYVKKYEMSEESKTMNMFEYGMQQLNKVIRQRKRGLISKSEYNSHRNSIEKNLMRL
jgi:hypothetical protein